MTKQTKIALKPEVVAKLSKALEINQSLQSLSLRDAHIGDEGCKLLCASLEKNRTLQSLNLHNNNIGPEGFKAISNLLITNSTLRSLNITGNCELHDAGLKYLSDAIAKNTSLQTLIISRCGVKEEAAMQLARVLVENNRTLRELKLVPNSSKNKKKNLVRKTPIASLFGFFGNIGKQDERTVDIIRQMCAFKPNFFLISDSSKYPSKYDPYHQNSK